MKKFLIVTSLLALVLVVSAGINVRADYLGFAGTAPSSWTNVSQLNGKNNNEYLAGVNWKTSQYSGHRMWFRIVNAEGQDRGKVLIERPGNGVKYLRTTASNGYVYRLQAKRENLWDPKTYITGTWQP